MKLEIWYKIIAAATTKAESDKGYYIVKKLHSSLINSTSAQFSSIKGVLHSNFTVYL